MPFFVKESKVTNINRNGGNVYHCPHSRNLFGHKLTDFPRLQRFEKISELAVGVFGFRFSDLFGDALVVDGGFHIADHAEGYGKGSP